jgi:hypothetical protein
MTKDISVIVFAYGGGAGKVYLPQCPSPFALSTFYLDVTWMYYMSLKIISSLK